MILEAILLLIASIGSKAIINQNPVKPGCPAVVPQENLLLEHFSGVWYEVQKHSSQFELGTCVSVNVGLSKATNETIINLRHQQKIANNFTNFYQNATVRRSNSVWLFRYNSSLIGELKLRSFHLKSKFFSTFWSWHRGIHLHIGDQLRQLRRRVLLWTDQQETKRRNGLDSKSNGHTPTRTCQQVHRRSREKSNFAEAFNQSRPEQLLIGDKWTLVFASGRDKYECETTIALMIFILIAANGELSV